MALLAFLRQQSSLSRCAGRIASSSFHHSIVSPQEGSWYKDHLTEITVIKHESTTNRAPWLSLSSFRQTAASNMSAMNASMSPTVCPSSRYSTGPSEVSTSSPLFSKPALPSKKNDSDVIGRAVLTKIKQSTKKVNLVTALVRGMRIDDAVAQLAVSQKRAAKTVHKVLQAAAANAVNNHGLDADKLVIAEAFVGKDKYLKRVSYHGRGKTGRRDRPRCILTVIVKHMSAEQEAMLSSLKSTPLPRRRRMPLLPHRLIKLKARPSHGTEPATN